MNLSEKTYKQKLKRSVFGKQSNEAIPNETQRRPPQRNAD